MGESDRAGQFPVSRESPVAGLTAAPMTPEANPVALTSYGQVPLGLEGSGASRRPGSIVRMLRTERWVRPTERAGSEGRFICCLRRQKNHTIALRASEMHPPLWWLAPPPCPVGSVSLDSQSPTAPCESSSLATRWEACHWIRGSRGSPMNPVPLPPPAVRWGGKKKAL